MTRALLIGLAVVTTAIFVVVPLVYIFVQALGAGWSAYAANIMHPLTLHAIWMTTLVAVIVRSAFRLRFRPAWLMLVRIRPPVPVVSLRLKAMPPDVTV